VYSYLLLTVVTALLLVTMGASALYYKRIRRVHEEYEEAKNIVGDITISVNRQFQRQEAGLRAVTHKIEIISSENEKVVKKVEEYDKRLATLAAIIEDAPAIEQKLSTQIEGVNKKVDDIKAAQNKIMQRIAEVEKIKYKVQVSEAKIEAAIPIKKEKALAPLTETELTALETIAKEGEKTAPEIREKIKLTREHTARLMKKLYEDGYLERDTHKMPYTYRLKEEMQKILKKREVRA
jgi:DNA-binding MarR family transcriptional regulator